MARFTPKAKGRKFAAIKLPSATLLALQTQAEQRAKAKAIKEQERMADVNQYSGYVATSVCIHVDSKFAHYQRVAELLKLHNLINDSRCRPTFTKEIAPYEALVLESGLTFSKKSPSGYSMIIATKHKVLATKLHKKEFPVAAYL